MDDERSFLSEARYALSLLCCVLVVGGYFALHRLAGTGQGPDIEVRHDVVQSVEPDDTASLPENQPQVLTVEPSTPTLPPAAERIATPESRPDQQSPSMQLR